MELRSGDESGRCMECQRTSFIFEFFIIQRTKVILGDSQARRRRWVSWALEKYFLRTRHGKLTQLSYIQVIGGEDTPRPPGDPSGPYLNPLDPSGLLWTPLDPSGLLWTPSGRLDPL